MRNSYAIIDVAVNVKNLPWGAVGDGEHDDTASINSALKAVADTGGGSVLIPAGKYRVTRPLAWQASDVTLVGDGGSTLVVSPGFVGDSVVRLGAASDKLNPTYRGGIRDVQVDMRACTQPDLIGVQLVQAWFTTVSHLRIYNVNGKTAVYQTGFQISAGCTDAALPMANWAANIHVENLQIGGSFRYSIRHVSGAKDRTKGQVNGVNYFGGSVFGAGKEVAGAVAMQLEMGDSTRVYGMALEDFETGCFVGTQNQGPFDFRMEDCAVPFRFGIPGLTARVAAVEFSK